MRYESNNRSHWYTIENQKYFNYSNNKKNIFKFSKQNRNHTLKKKEMKDSLEFFLLLKTKNEQRRRRRLRCI